MSIVRNIDVTMQSEVSFDEACRGAVTEAGKTLRGIMSFKVNEMRGRARQNHRISCDRENRLPS
jgi:flavin-binding protein dodecin